MSWNPKRLRFVAVLVLTLALAGPLASAGAAGHERTGPNRWESSSISSHVLTTLWSFVRSALGLRPVTQSAACGGDRGAGLDPNGCGTGGTNGGGDTGVGGGSGTP